MKKQKKIAAIPPDDYIGSMADWDTRLIEMGLMKPGQLYLDIMITEDEWWDILESCERRHPDDYPYGDDGHELITGRD